MDDPIRIEGMDVCISERLQKNNATVKSEAPFKILIMGDFSGRSNRDEETDGSGISGRKLFKVDRDSDEQVMEKMGVSVRLDILGKKDPPVELAFAEMDDFHPEQVYSRTPIFTAMQETRKRLLDPGTASATIARLSGGLPPESGAAGPDPDHPQAAPDYDFSRETTAGLLDQVLDAGIPSPANAGKSKPQTDWDRFLGGIVGPHLVPDMDKAQDAMLEAIDRTIAASMRSILHHPDFQALESAWRGLRFCLRRLETDEKLEVLLLDVSKAELASDLTTREDLEDTAVYRKLASASGQQSGRAPWSLLAGMFTFSPSRDDAVLAARLAALGQMLGAPFIAGGDCGLAGCPSLSALPDPSGWTAEPDTPGRQAWRVLRTLPEARWMGLALPRLLMRLPYGKDTDPVDAFDLEEMIDQTDHEAYLWANPIFGVVLILGRTFSESGWNWSRGMQVDVDDLPLHVFEDRGERMIKPCAEVLLSDRAITALVDNGLMPLVSLKDRGCVRLVRFQSMANPPSPLRGPWGG